MAQLQRKNRVKDQTTTTGTGTITLGLVAPTGYEAGSSFTTGRRVKTLIQNADGSEWELSTGIITNTAGTWTVTRVTVEESSNSDALVSFSAGTKTVVLSPASAWDFDVPEFATGANIASASTIDLDAATGERVHVTGTTTITAVTLTRGPRTVIFDGALTLTHHATNNNLPGGANITTAAGDRAIYASDGTTVYCIAYTRASDGAVTLAATQTLTNKRVTPRIGSTTSSATPTINTDNVDIYRLTAQTVDITSFTTNLSGTPSHGDVLVIEITGTAARAITWGASFEASTVALPTTTVSTNMLQASFTWNSATSKWRCVGAC